MAPDPSFEIPARPVRRYPSGGGVEYTGGTVFELHPPDPGTPLEARVETVLAEGPYRRNEFFELPMAVWLVRDDGTGDVFRVSVRETVVHLHVLPDTDPDGLRRFYERLEAETAGEWTVTRRVRSE